MCDATTHALKLFHRHDSDLVYAAVLHSHQTSEITEDNHEQVVHGMKTLQGLVAWDKDKVNSWGLTGLWDCLLLSWWRENWAEALNFLLIFVQTLTSDHRLWVVSERTRSQIEADSCAGWLTSLCMIGWRVQQRQSTSICSRCSLRLRGVDLGGSSAWLEEKRTTRLLWCASTSRFAMFWCWHPSSFNFLMFVIFSSVANLMLECEKYDSLFLQSEQSNIVFCCQSPSNCVLMTYTT